MYDIRVPVVRYPGRREPQPTRGAEGPSSVDVTGSL
jgi:hypothetical protein